MSAINAVLPHTCTVEVGTLSTSADPYHPGSSNRQVSYANPTQHAGTRCRLQQLNLRDIGEITGQGLAGTSVLTHYLYMSRAVAPATLIDLDSTPHPASYHRITAVLNKAGATVDSGPFDIQRVIDMAGQADVIKLELKRVT